jgi:hypothetical protein
VPREVPPDEPVDFGLAKSEPFTVEGEIERWGMFAAGTARVRGWAAVTLWVLVVGTVLLLGAGVVIGLLNKSASQPQWPSSPSWTPPPP